MTSNKNKHYPRVYATTESNRNQQSEIDYKKCCVAYLLENGPEPRRTALQGMNRRYNEEHTANAQRYPGHRPPIALRMRMALLLQQAIMEGLIIKGPRPDQILTLPNQTTTLRHARKSEK
tara:strand:- start:246 stop:605 length:360 start_codon:yes stop_codon:yes gene_type:complete